MKCLEVLKRLFLLLWAFLRPSKLPRCPRCKVEMDAHNDHIPWLCEQRCGTCAHVAYVDLRATGNLRYCAHPNKLGRWRAKTDWCRQWDARDRKENPHDDYSSPPAS
ncbi:MAG TPA: hypothetical protein VMW24_23715 [Sedimentisphaerales bacterium]|nr:hypothetical protein [Sedimentisphaerales bacterium]